MAGMTRSVGPAAPAELLAGLVERVTFHNPDNGFSVLRVKARGVRDLVTVIGHAAAIHAGEFVQAQGGWVNDREHGVQFRARSLVATLPTTREGIEKYLASGMVRGIGPVYAKRLVEAFGETLFDAIGEHPERLCEVHGIGPKRIAKIVGGWADQRAVREIMLFLHSNGVGTSRAVRIYKTYGTDAIRLISENPYRLARDIRGIGFRTADQIATKLGIEPTAVIRLRAGIGFALNEATSDDHCALPTGELLRMTAKLLDVPAELVTTALELELADAEVIADTVAGQACIFLTGLFRAEREIAERLRALARGALPWPRIDADAAIPWVGQSTGLHLAPSQEMAVRTALASPVLVITGGPGVGKTTLVKSILQILLAKKIAISLGAPTGRAAKRLAESTGMPAKTIHRLLEADPAKGGFKRQQENPLETQLLVVDECSMVDVPLMLAILRALPRGAALLLVGDVDQLPSVGPGQVLADIIGSSAVPVVRLSEVFRQAAGSRIITNAHRINQGLMPELPGRNVESDFYFADAEAPETGAARLLTLVAERIPRRFGLDPIRDIQVLCPMNRGGLGARSLNLELQQRLNPPGEARIERFGWVFAAGDKVMQTENNYTKDVFNGDVGIVARVDLAEGELAVDFDGREVSYEFGELDELVLAYAVTIHKSQGSEYPAVVIPLATQHYTMLARNLVYTAVTRAKQLVVLVGQRKALAIAVKTADRQIRWTKLDEWLVGCEDDSSQAPSSGGNLKPRILGKKAQWQESVRKGA